MESFQGLITFQWPTCKQQQKYFLLISWLSELHFKLMIFFILLLTSAGIPREKNLSDKLLYQLISGKTEVR